MLLSVLGGTGTFGVAQILADVTAAGGITIIGGGDSVRRFLYLPFCCYVVLSSVQFHCRVQLHLCFLGILHSNSPLSALSTGGCCGSGRFAEPDEPHFHRRGGISGDVGGQGATWSGGVG